jgi:hypothetical protein
MARIPASPSPPGAWPLPPPGLRRLPPGRPSRLPPGLELVGAGLGAAAFLEVVDVAPPGAPGFYSPKGERPVI